MKPGPPCYNFRLAGAFPSQTMTGASDIRNIELRVTFCSRDSDF